MNMGESSGPSKFKFTDRSPMSNRSDFDIPVKKLAKKHMINPKMIILKV